MSEAQDSVKRVALALEAEGNPVLVTYEEFSKAFLGFGTRGSGADPLACYDYEKCLEILQETEEWPISECEEWLVTNYVNAWRGDGTPFFLKKFFA